MSIVNVPLPKEWATAPIQESEIFFSGSYEGGPELHVLGVLLEDGTNVFVLAGEKGSRAARTSASNGWAIEERYTGEPLVCGDMWRMVLAQMSAARASVEAERGRPS